MGGEREDKFLSSFSRASLHLALLEKKRREKRRKKSKRDEGAESEEK